MTDTQPTKYFVVTGKGLSDTSEINAFDKALMNAGIEKETKETKEWIKGSIANQNVVTVSSIIPPGCQRTDPVSLPIGKITHCVLARMSGHEGQTISAGIVLASLSEHYIVAEGHDYVDKPFLQKYLCHKAAEMAEARNERIKTKEGYIPHEKEWEEKELRNLVDKFESEINHTREKNLLELLTTEADREKLTIKLTEFTKEVKDLPKQRRVMLEGFAKDIKKLPKLYDKELVKYIDNGLEVKVATIREISEDYGCTIATVVFYD